MDIPGFKDISRAIKIAAFIAQHEADVMQIIAAAQKAVALVKAAEAAGLLSQPQSEH